MEPDGSSTSVRNVLLLLRGPVMAVRSPSLLGLCTKFDTKIAELENRGNPRIALESLQIPLDSCLFSLMKHAVPKCPPKEESTSLRDFLVSLRAATYHIDHPSLESFHQKLESKILELSARDMQIAIKIVDRAMDYTLFLLEA